jgi:hypothetical protein
MENKKPALLLTVDLINQLLMYLAKRPYDEVFALIGEIQGQAQAQVQQEPTEKPESEAVKD